MNTVRDGLCLGMSGRGARDRIFGRSAPKFERERMVNTPTYFTLRWRCHIVMCQSAGTFLERS